MARRIPPRKVRYFEPVAPRLARNTDHWVGTFIRSGLVKHFWNLNGDRKVSPLDQRRPMLKLS